MSTVVCTIATLKSIVLSAANASSNPGFEGTFATTHDFNKAVRAKWPKGLSSSRFSCAVPVVPLKKTDTFTFNVVIPLGH
ncbi:MAG: hypothetical protein HC768_07865 [Acaryochloris sp. CRU_2_0]|nr:hypothetical protein [Acaryochloris sp. CRU_2_0]